MPPPREGYSPVPTVAPKDIPTPSIRVQFPDVHFTRAIGEAMGELGHGFGVAGGAQETVGAALGSAGRMIQGAGNELFQRAEAIQLVKNQAEENELRTKYDMDSSSLFAQYEAKKGLDATGSFDAFVEQQKKLREDYKAKASNVDVGRRFDNSTMQMMGRTIFSAARHSATEQKSVVVQASKARIQQEAINVEKNYQDPNQYRQSLDTVRKEIRSQRYILGQPAEVAKVREQEEINTLALARINGMSKEKPFEAWDLFNKLRETGDVYGPKVEQLEHTLQERVRLTGARNASDTATKDLRSDTPDTSRTPQERAQQAVEEYQKVVTGDPEGEKRAWDETIRKYGQWETAQNQFHRQAMDQIVGGVSGRMSDGNIPKNIDEFLAIPKMGPLYDKLNNKEKAQVRDMIYQANVKAMRVDPLTSRENFGALRGMAVNDPDQFLEKTQNPYDPSLKLNPHERDQLDQLRQKITKDPVGRSDLVKNKLTLMRNNFGAQMEALGIFRRDSKNPDDYDKFTSAIQQSLEVFHEAHGRMPTDSEFVKNIAPDLLKYKPSSWFPWQREEKPAWMAEPTDKWLEDHEKLMKSRGQPVGDPYEIQRDWVRHQLLELELKRQQGK